ncbi:hypothetical protein PSCLAVI8L_100183 [Pseudoclavibacter sp. 8L]|nr:hypothetical protein PSCLAVI8L_100183 [Pseudoclavibacter sp. 8L]
MTDEKDSASGSPGTGALITEMLDLGRIATALSLTAVGRVQRWAISSEPPTGESNPTVGHDPSGGGGERRSSL